VIYAETFGYGKTAFEIVPTGFAIAPILFRLALIGNPA
jgi:hypothetical protein